MAKYIVVDGQKIIGKDTFEPGDIVEVSEAVAARLRLRPAQEEEVKKKKGKGREEE